MQGILLPLGLPKWPRTLLPAYAVPHCKWDFSHAWNLEVEVRP